MFYSKLYQRTPWGSQLMSGQRCLKGLTRVLPVLISQQTNDRAGENNPGAHGQTFCFKPLRPFNCSSMVPKFCADGIREDLVPKRHPKQDGSHLAQPDSHQKPSNRATIAKNRASCAPAKERGLHAPLLCPNLLPPALVARWITQQSQQRVQESLPVQEIIRGRNPGRERGMHVGPPVHSREGLLPTSVEVILPEILQKCKVPNVTLMQIWRIA
jgi:hypothetical protein